jgi:hypothetical protein
MKIEFFWVTGHVAIDDKCSFQEARTGMKLETGGRPHIVLTGPDSHAQLLIDGKEISLSSNSVLYVGYPKPSSIKGTAQTLKTLAGKIWAKIDKGRWDEIGGGGGGIRG